MNCFRAQITSNIRIAPDHYVLSFKAPRISKKVKPGQFFNIRVNDSCDPLLRRPFSVHNIGKGKIGILYKVIGKATQILSCRKKGEMLDVLGPLGNGFDIKSTVHSPQSTVILVAGGHGVAPLYALAKKLKTYNLKLITFMGAKTKKHIVCDKDFRKIGAKVYVATEDGSKGYKGLITDLLIKKPTAHSPQPIALYACGPKPMLKAVAKIASRHKLSCQVSMEEYIGCGTGVCMGCSVKTRSGNKLVCKDGPVFNARDIVW